MYSLYSLHLYMHFYLFTLTTLNVYATLRNIPSPRIGKFHHMVMFFENKIDEQTFWKNHIICFLSKKQTTDTCVPTLSITNWSCIFPLIAVYMYSYMFMYIQKNYQISL